MFNFDATWRKIHNVITKLYYISDHDIHRLLRKIHYTVYKQYSNINSDYKKLYEQKGYYCKKRMHIEEVN